LEEGEAWKKAVVGQLMRAYQDFESTLGTSSLTFAKKRKSISTLIRISSTAEWKSSGST